MPDCGCHVVSVRVQHGSNAGDILEVAHCALHAAAGKLLSRLKANADVFRELAVSLAGHPDYTSVHKEAEMALDADGITRAIIKEAEA